MESDAIGFAEDHASEKQRKFQRAFETRLDEGRRVDIFAAMGANRSGKTYVGCWMCFAKHLRDRAKDGDVYWCIAPTLDRSIAGQQKELWKSLPRWMFAEEHWQQKIGFGGHRKIVLQLTGGGECVVEFHSADQDATTFEQEAVSGIWIDESLPESVYSRLIPRIIDRRGFIIITDIYEQFWYMERLKEVDPSAGVYFQILTMYDNAHNLPPGEIEVALGRMSGDDAKLRVYGELVVLEGVVYKEYRDDVHAVDPFPAGIPRDWPRWRAIDYGGSAPTACVWFALAPNEQVFAYREYYQKGLSVARNAAAIIEMSGDEKYVQTFMDPHAVDPPPVYYGASKTIAEQYTEAGIASTGWPFINVMGEHACVQRVKFKLENGQLFIFKPCTALRREFRSWKYKLDKDGKPVAQDAFENANNHALDCVKGFVASRPTYAQAKARIIE